MTTIASCDLPRATVQRFSSRTRPSPGTVCDHASLAVGNANGCNWSANQWAAPRAPLVPGRRSGKSVDSVAARRVVVSASNAGGRSGGGSGDGCRIVNAASRSGSERTRKAAR